MNKKDDFDFDLDFQKEFGEDTGVLPDGYGEDDLLAEFLNEPLPGQEAPAPAPQEEPTLSAGSCVPDAPADEPELDLSDIDFGTPEEPQLHFDPPAQEPAAPAQTPDVSEYEPDVSEYPSEEPQYPQYEQEKPRRKPAPAPQEPPLSRAEQRRLQKRRKRKIKELYLPAALAGLTLVMILIFIIGGVSRGAAARKDKQDADQQASQSAASAAEALEDEAERLLKEAQVLADGYNFQGAIDLLDSFSGELSSFPALLNAKSDYSRELTNVKAWSDPKEIVNLSFHVLIADPTRAFTDGTYGAAYNKSFVTIDEFQKILEQLYANGYVLVDLDDVVKQTTAEDGTVSYTANTIYLPNGKTPFMLTETMVNYFRYMVDPDKDGVPDAKGSGFANKLVVDDNGDIKAQLVTAEGETVVGNYDLVPILEDFIQEHPDFAYGDARAILAVCGQDGIFGYRITDSNADKEIAGAKELVQALRDKGYTLACYSFDNLDYNKQSVSGIQKDMESWNAKIKPVLGNVDVMVFARGVDLAEYTGTKFDVLYTSGFRFFLGAASAPTAEVTSTYFHQNRLMVTGTQMAYNSSLFTKYFNSMNILNDQRGTVPT